MKRLLSLLIAIPLLASAKMMAPDNVPIDRLIKNVEASLKKDPKSVDNIFLLARLHSLAYASKKATAAVYWSDYQKKDGSFHLAPWAPIQVQRDDKEPELSAEATNHLIASMSTYRRVLLLQPDHRVAKLGLGWMAEEGAKHTKELKTLDWIKEKPLDKGLRSYAASLYRELVGTYKANPNLESQGWDGEEPAYESARNLLRMFGAGLTPKPGEKDKLEALIKDFQRRPRIMSPIIVPLTQGPMVNPAASIHFDIAADGIDRSWPWVTPNVGLLAWDPAGTGRIKNGEQLFGNRTFNMFFRDGYAALASLDNNHDGWLDGAELKGIVIWRDSNSNGKSDPGEVLPVANVGITAIRTKSSGRAQGMLSAEKGVRFRSGLTAPTYDWWPTSHFAQQATR
jgi:hypothetical protein